MSIRKNTNPRPLDIQPELQDILVRNGMRAHIRGSSNGFQLVVQGHDSPLLSYPISEKQLKALTDWGTNSANKRAFNTFASIVAADFDMPKDFVHARNANGRVAMGLHGYRIGAGEYGRLGWGHRFLGWTPRQQGGLHLRRIGGNLFFPGAPIVPDRPDGLMKPGELQSGGYGFYYKGRVGIEGNVPQKQDVLKELESVITPIVVKQRNNEPAKPYKELITSPVYFSNEKLQECLRSHGISIDTEAKTMTIQSSGTQADFVYDLTDEEVKKLTSNSIKEEPVKSRLSLINDIIREDFAEGITMEQFNSDKQIVIALHPAVQEDLDSKDEIVLPEKSQFLSGAAFYGTALHEMTHSTGADSRLGRFKNGNGSFGSREYAREELVAELGSALVAQRHGISKNIKEESAAYLKSWLSELKESPDYIKTTLLDVKRASAMITSQIDRINEKLNNGIGEETAVEERELEPVLQEEETVHYGRGR